MRGNKNSDELTFGGALPLQPSGHPLNHHTKTAPYCPQLYWYYDLPETSLILITHYSFSEDRLIFLVVFVSSWEVFLD